MRFLILVALYATPVLADCLLVKVTDPSRLPIAGAVVKNGSETAASDLRGEAKLCADERAAVVVEAAGFRTVRLHPAAGTNSVSVQLEVARRIESPVVVTGVIEPTELTEIDRTVEVLDLTEPNTPAWSFADVLKQDSAVHLRERGPDGTQADLSIRGSSFDQVLVLVNGVRVNDAQTGHHTLDLPLPFEAVQQVEVLHGSGAVLYGSDAIGGAINFVTKKPQGGEMRLMSGIGEHGWNRLAANGGFRRGIWSQSLSVSRDFSSGFAPGRDFRNLAFAAETYFDGSHGSTSILFSANDRPFGANGFYGPWDSWEKTGTKLVSVSQSLGRSGGVQHRFNFTYRRHNDNFILCKPGCVFGDTLFAPEDFQNLHQTENYQGGYSAAGSLGERVRWTAGGQYVSEGIDSTVAGMRRRERVAAFAMLNMRPTDRLTLSAGVREEAWGRWRSQTSPTVSAGYRLAGGFKLRGQAASAFRIPTYTDLYHVDPGNVGNPNLLPETAWNYELGGDWYSTGGLRVSATWFRRVENNAIDWIRDAGSSVFQARNFQELDFKGAEFQIRQRWSNSEAWLSYTSLRADRKLPVDAVSRYVFNFPRNQTTLGYRGDFKGLLIKTQVGAYDREWQSTRALWDISLGRAEGRWRPFIQATNLLNSSHEAFQGLAQPGRWFRGGLQVRVY